jgi:glucokinase
LSVKKIELVAGVDLGGTETKFGLVNREGDLLAYQSIPTDPNIGYEAFFTFLVNEIKNLLLTLGEDITLYGVGVGAPTGSQINGTIENPSNLNWPNNLPVSNIIESLLGLPVTVVNDANAAAVGEMLFGVAQGFGNFFCVTLGTGLGCGVVINSELMLGSMGHAGELGHVTAIKDGRTCGCGRKGCLETYASATGIVRTVLETNKEEFKRSMLHSYDENQLTAKHITNAAKAGDPLALKAFDFTGKMLGEQLADTVAILNPELIVLTGGLTKAGDLLLNPTKKYMDGHLHDMYKGSVEIRLSEMNTIKTAILGSAAFMWLKLDNATKETA